MRTRRRLLDASNKMVFGMKYLLVIYLLTSFLSFILFFRFATTALSFNLSLLLDPVVIGSGSTSQLEVTGAKP